jgi:ABC-2 type transport system permease protein
MEVRKALSYRVDFWVQFLGGLLAQVAVAYFLWKAMYGFNGAGEIGGYSFAGMMVYSVLAPLVMRVVRGVETGLISEEIYEGTLTRYLIYPVSLFGYKLISYVANSALYFIQAAVVFGLLLLVYGTPADFNISPVNVLISLVVICAAMYLHFVLVMSLEMVAFWADNVWSLVVILRFLSNLLGGALIPLSLFPAQLLLFNDFLPFGVMVSFPIRVLLGQADGREYLVGALGLLGWSAIFTATVALLWHRGRYRYTGVGI